MHTSIHTNLKVYGYLHQSVYKYIDTYICTYMHAHLHARRHQYAYMRTYVHAGVQITCMHPSHHPSIPPSVRPFMHPAVHSRAPRYACIRMGAHLISTYLAYLLTYLPTYLATYRPTYLRTIQLSKLWKQSLQAPEEKKTTKTTTEPVAALVSLTLASDITKAKVGGWGLRFQGFRVYGCRVQGLGSGTRVSCSLLEIIVVLGLGVQTRGFGKLVVMASRMDPKDQCSNCIIHKPLPPSFRPRQNSFLPIQLIIYSHITTSCVLR